MRPLALVTGWTASPRDEVECLAILEAATHRFAGPAQVVPFPTGVMGFRPKRDELAKGVTWTDQVSGVAALVDARIHNRADLATQLGSAPDQMGDAELVARSYLRWGQGFLPKLVGDFALVVCDWGHAEILLATGSNAARTLFYAFDQGRAFVASDPDQLRVRAFRPSDIDPEQLRDYLVGQHREPERTLYRSLRRVPPGFCTTLRSRGAEARRFFLPPQSTISFRTRADLNREFEHLFRRCVTDSVDLGAHHLVHLSGGLDSSSIVGALNQMPPDGRTSFDVATAVFPTLLSCNETAAVASVRRRVRFRARTWDAEATPSLSREMALSPWPLGLVMMAIANHQDLDTASDDGAVAVISGDGGDGLIMESIVFQDLVIRRRWRTLWDQLGAQGLSSRMRRYLVSRVVLQVLHRLADPLANWRQQTTMPPWAGPEVTRMTLGAGRYKSVEAGALPDLVQRHVWATMTDPTDTAGYEAMQIRAARVGVELRCPYRDQRLVQFVLSIPLEYRLPDGISRRLQREGLASLIPSEVRKRAKTEFSPAVRALFIKEKAMMEEGVRDGPWLIAPYVDRKWVRQTIAIAGNIDDFKLWQLLRRIWTLELWMRRNLV